MERLDTFLKNNADVRSFKAGALIFASGAEAKAAYFIARGRVDILQPSGAEEMILVTLGPGEIFGEMALLRFDQYTMSARAAEDVQAYVITPDMLYAEIRKTHPLVKSILDMLVDRVHAANEILTDLDQANQTLHKYTPPQ